MTRRLALLVTLASTACAHEGKMAWTFEPGSTSRLRATPIRGIEAVSLADDEVVTIDAAGKPTTVANGAKGGPIDESDEPVLGSGPEHWLTLPEQPRIMMLQWPLPTTGVTSAFGARADPIEGDARFHYGIDLEAQYGQVVRAAAAGRVGAVGWNNGHGRQIMITHAGGFHTGYSHLSSTMVYEGQIVEAGEPLGLVGTSGRTTGPHLHFEVMRYGSHVDPLSVLGVPIKLR